MGLGLRFESARKEEEEGWSNCYVSLSQQVEFAGPQFLGIRLQLQISDNKGS